MRVHTLRTYGHNPELAPQQAGINLNGDHLCAMHRMKIASGRNLHMVILSFPASLHPVGLILVSSAENVVPPSILQEKGR